MQSIPESGNTELAVRELITELFDRNVDRLSLDEDPAEFLGIDSLSRLSMLAMVEERFGLNLSDKEFVHLDTLRDIVRRVEIEQKPLARRRFWRARATRPPERNTARRPYLRVAR